MTADVKHGKQSDLGNSIINGKIPSPKTAEIRSAASTTRSSIQGRLTPGFNDISLEGYLKKIHPDGASINQIGNVIESATHQEEEQMEDEEEEDEEVYDFLDNSIINEKYQQEQGQFYRYESPEAKIGLDLLPAQCELLAHKKGENFTLMVAGRVGTGKSTFINTLFGTQLIEPSTTVGTTKIGINKFKLIEHGFQLNLTTIDTPGFGNKINNKYNWTPICNFIDEQFRNYLFQLEQPDRSRLVDNRVHCCLYFIESSGTSLTPLDILSMQNISKRVNLIPVISKSDILSREELSQYKNLIKNQLSVHKINICELILDDLVREKIYDSIPFAIIGTNDFSSQKLSRKYNWGTVNIENDSNCDYLLLKKILLSENMLDLISSTETCFDNYRLECLETRFQQSSLAAKYNDEKRAELSGFDQLKIYNQTSLDKFEEIEDIHNESSFEIRQDDIKDKLGSFVSKEELRFKNWKKNLVDKQSELNKDIEIQHKKMVSLQNLVDVLETGSAAVPELESFSEDEEDIKSII